MKEVTDFLNRLQPKWEPLKQQAIKYFDIDSKLHEDGALRVFRRIWVAPQNFGIILFPPVDINWFFKFQEKTNIIIPQFYQNILLEMNGCYVYDFKLFGLPKSLYTLGQLDRTKLQQLDLGAANTFWKNEYKTDKGLFMIGGRDYSFHEIVGYFIDEKTIYSIRKNGEVISAWSSFENFFKEEINHAEEMMLDEKNNKK
jgi:hypothetical protein